MHLEEYDTIFHFFGGGGGGYNTYQITFDTFYANMFDNSFAALIHYPNIICSVHWGVLGMI